MEQLQTYNFNKYDYYEVEVSVKEGIKYIDFSSCFSVFYEIFETRLYMRLDEFLKFSKEEIQNLLIESVKYVAELNERQFLEEFANVCHKNQLIEKIEASIKPGNYLFKHEF